MKIQNASNGVIIKAFASGQGTINNATYQDFTIQNTAFPIKLDYTWGDTLGGKAAPPAKASGNQAWTNINFINFQGTGQSSRALITLNCSPASKCSGINFQNIKLSGSDKNNFMSNTCGKTDQVSAPLLKAFPQC